MTLPAMPSGESRTLNVSRLLAAAVAIGAMLVLIRAWLETRAAFAWEWPHTSVPAAGCFLILASALACFGLPTIPGRNSRLVRGAGLVVFAAGSVLLLSLALRTEWGLVRIRGLDWRAWLPAGVAVTTAFNFVLFGLALALYRDGKMARLGQSLVGASGFVAWLTVIAYAYDVPAIHRLGRQSGDALMVVHAATAFLLLAIAYFAAQPRFGLTAILMSNTVSGRMTRRLLPAAFLAPTVFGWIRLAGEERGYYGTPAGVALFAVIVTASMTAVILASARRLHVEEEVRKSAEMARRGVERQVAEQARLLDLTFDAIIVRGDGDRITYWNRGATELYGWMREETLGRVSQDLLATQFPESREKVMQAVLRDGRWSGEVIHTRRDGTRVNVFTRWSLDRDPDGKRGSILETNNDITTAKRTEMELRESRGKLELLDSLAEATRAVNDPRGIMAIVARRVGEHLRASRCAYADVERDGEHFVIHQDYTDGVPSVAGNYELNLFGPRAAAKMRSGRTLVIRDMDRELAPDEGADTFNALGIKAIICCPLLKEGTLRAMMAVHQTTPRPWTTAEVALMELVVERSWAYIERARAEAGLRDSERQLRLIADAMPGLVAYVGPDLRYRFANAEYQAWFGIESADLIGRTIGEVLGDNVAAQLRPHLTRALGGDDVRFELPIEYRNGPRWIHAHYMPHHNDRGEVQGIFVLVLDITERKRTETQLARAREDLERQVQERTATLRDTIAQLETFSYSITHDMRGPLRAMVSFAQILQSDFAADLAAEGREYLQRIVDAARRLDQLIQDVLQYSRVARDSLPIEAIDLERLLRDVIHQYPDIAEHAHRIQVQTGCGDTVVHANQAALTQVISNLIGNALKFVPRNRTPRVRIRCEDRGDRVRLVVQDNGLGVPPDQREKIFGVFERLHGVEYPGTGIGLSIVKKAVERMGGSVGVESEVGQGSEFWVELVRAEVPVAIGQA